VPDGISRPRQMAFSEMKGGGDMKRDRKCRMELKNDKLILHIGMMHVDVERVA
jgi:hypothetical protein